MTTAPMLYVVDDDDAVRDALRMRLSHLGYEVATFEGAQAFLASVDPARPGCAIVDLRMPGMDGLMLQEEIVRRALPLAVVFLTAYGDIPTTVKAVKAGAVDFLTKPVGAEELVESVRAALASLEAHQSRTQARRDVQALVARLTRREREIMDMILKGMTNKLIARALGISHRTVELHRLNMMRKVGAQTPLELSQLTGRSFETAGPPGPDAHNRSPAQTAHERGEHAA